jgi:hypothetical protein
MISERYRRTTWDFARQVRRDRVAQLIDVKRAKLLFPEALTEEHAREILLAALSDPFNPPSDAGRGMESGTLVAAFGENVYLVLTGTGTGGGLSEKALRELKHLVDRMQQERHVS